MQNIRFMYNMHRIVTSQVYWDW